MPVMPSDHPHTAPDPESRPRKGSRPGYLHTDGGQVQCHECGNWYITLNSHINRTHGISAAQYRIRWSLPPDHPIAAEQMRATARRNAIEGDSVAFLHPGNDGPVGSHMPDSRRDKADADPRWASGDPATQHRRLNRLGTMYLHRAGFVDWDDALAWSSTSGRDWIDIAIRTGQSPEQLAQLAAAAGVALNTASSEPAASLTDREYLATAFSERGWADWSDAWAWLNSVGGNLTKLAAELDIHPVTLRRVAASHRQVIAVRESRMTGGRVVDLAETFFAEHGHLVPPPDAELEREFQSWRAFRQQRPNTVTQLLLDSLDPDWVHSYSEAKAALLEGEPPSFDGGASSSDEWIRRRNPHGWATIADAIYWAATNFAGITEIAEALRADATRVRKAARRPAVLEEAERRIGEVLTSPPGELAVHDDRLQCQLCGMWFGSLGRHFSWHGLTAKEYKERCGYPAGVQIAPPSVTAARARGSRNARAVQDEKVRLRWERLLAEAGVASFQELLDWAALNGGIPAAAKRLGVSEYGVEQAAKRAGAVYVNKGEMKMRALEQHAREHRSLRGLTPELTDFLRSIRISAARGAHSERFARLDAVAPDWRQP